MQAKRSAESRTGTVRASQACLNEFHLVLFARAARVGRVKTRLAAEIGPIAAWHFYRCTLASMLRCLIRDCRWQCWLALDGRGRNTRAGLPTLGWRCIRQGTGDLGRRMALVLKQMPPGPVVIVGSDAPEVSRAHIMRAFRLLGRYDVVFGPALDGGYWLIGVCHRYRSCPLFADVRWSTRNALSDTLANIPCLKVGLLDLLEDVDDGSAYVRWRRRVG